MIYLKISLVLITITNFVSSIPPPNINELLQYKLKPIEVTEEARFTTPELIKKYGYPVELHSVTTEDGYILELHRIPHGHNSIIDNKNKSVVLVEHGLISNSVESVLAGPGNALSLFLADSGYDVWIGNSRGNRYSRKHVSLSPKSRKYWNFTWSEIGYYDLPAMIDYIIQTTKQKKIFYIGHSRGTMTSYVLCSTRPEYNEKFRAIISLAPVAYMSHVPNLGFRFVGKYVRSLEKVFHLLGLNHIIFDLKFISRAGEVFCQKLSLTQPICPLVIFAVAGFDKHFNASLIPFVMGHLPDALSMKEFVHFGQLVKTGKFRRYDYGYIQNLRHYNTMIPPSYNLTKITAPVALFYSTNDAESSVVDTDQLYSELGNPIDRVLLDVNHLSYFYGKNLRKIYLERVLEIFEKY